MAKNKLELNWIGKNEYKEIEPRILIENPEFSNVKLDAKTENMLIHGDNLLALKALENNFSNKVKLIYIDPPYNTGSAFEHYDDNLEHSIWLSLMKPRLEILKKLLTEDGSLWVQIDDNEMPYLTVLLDEVFGRRNRVNIIAVKMSEASGVKMAHVEKRLPKLKEYILVYKKSDEFTMNPQRVQKDNIDGYLKYYNKMILNKDADVENWEIVDIIDYMKKNNMKTDTQSVKRFKLVNSDNVIYRTNNASFKNYDIKEDLAKIVSPRGIEYIWWEGKQMLFLTDYITEYLCDLWLDISTINLNKEGVVDFNQSKKPEKLSERIVSIASNPNDLVLDSFLGSGTTAAVAHKMGRKWIGVEMGDHAHTLSKVRLDAVIEGSDQSGISSEYEWEGGGGYKFYELAPTLIKFDEFEQPIINSDYNADMLAAAISIHEGYTYDPSKEVYWKQSYSSENSYLFVTTNHISNTYLEAIYNQMKENEYLLISCKSFDSNLDKKYKNIAIKKIPDSILENCEFGKDNYNLNIISPPIYNDEEDNNE